MKYERKHSNLSRVELHMSMEGLYPNQENLITIEMHHHHLLRKIQNMSELYELESENIAEAIIWCQSLEKNHLDYNLWIELHK